MKTAWGDVRRGIWMAVIRKGLFILNQKTESKTWRPNPLVLSGAPTKRWHLIEFAAAITHNRGILTIATVLKTDHTTTSRRIKLEQNIYDFLAKQSTRGFARVIEASNIFEGATDFVKSYGIGTLVPNTIIVGDSENKEIKKGYCGMISRFHNLNRNVIILRDNKEKGFGKKERIDLWWGGLKGNGGLLMILAYLLRSSLSWYDAEINIKMMVPDENAAKAARRNLSSVVKKLRTGAELTVIVSEGRSFTEVFQESSSDADLIFMGMATPDENFVDYYTTMQERLKNMPTTMLVLAAEKISFGEVLMQQDAFHKD